MYRHTERMTIDNEWAYYELLETIDDVVMTYWRDNRIEEKYRNRAVYNSDIIKEEYTAEMIKQNVIEQGKDLIEIYNEQYDRRRSEGKFGIHYYEDWIRSEISKILKWNEVRK